MGKIGDTLPGQLFTIAKWGIIGGVTAIAGGMITKVALTALGYSAAAAKVGSALSLVGKVALLGGAVGGIAAAAMLSTFIVLSVLCIAMAK